MSHSITSTASYVLNKYSRSYPLAVSSVGAQESEWQHYTNPVMRIILEAKKSLSGQLVSMRLKILWSIHADPNDLENDQGEVVFEDLELLSFSQLPALQTSGAQSDQSLPLKAVYRDAVVGFRYLHPKMVPSGSQPTYRRFQITFKDAQDALRCIDAIKSVCPCRANPHPTHLNRQSTLLSTSLMRTATTVPGLASVRPVATLTESLDSGLVSLNRRPGNRPFPTPTASVERNLSSDDSAFVTCPETPYKTDSQADNGNGRPIKRRHLDATQSSLPNSSQPSSSDQSANMPPPPVPRRVAHESDDAATQEPSRTVNTGDHDEGAPLLASLSKHPSLYGLSRTDLETLVGHVIREEGFLSLLESLDSLWRIKGLVGN